MENWREMGVYIFLYERFGKLCGVQVLLDGQAPVVGWKTRAGLAPAQRSDQVFATSGWNLPNRRPRARGQTKNGHEIFSRLASDSVTPGYMLSDYYI